MGRYCPGKKDARRTFLSCYMFELNELYQVSPRFVKPAFSIFTENFSVGFPLCAYMITLSNSPNAIPMIKLTAKYSRYLIESCMIVIYSPIRFLITSCANFWASSRTILRAVTILAGSTVSFNSGGASSGRRILPSAMALPLLIS